MAIKSERYVDDSEIVYSNANLWRLSSLELIRSYKLVFTWECILSAYSRFLHFKFYDHHVWKAQMRISQKHKADRLSVLAINFENTSNISALDETIQTDQSRVYFLSFSCVTSNCMAAKILWH